MSKLAIVNAAGKVVTFVRADLPEGWTPPPGTTAVPSVELAPEWEWETPPPAPVAEVPQCVTPRQIRRALNDAGLRATVEAAIAAADQATRDDWEFALEIRRDWPALAGMAAALGLTGAQVDTLFTQAATY
jgi:hypothetical protein